jgi:16S rRNA (guanine527-N7)-methyltransferase
MHDLWTRIAADAAVPLSPEQLGQLQQYLDALIETNAVLNLTRITTPEEARVKHVADALTLLRHVPAGTKTIGDVGTGGGIPGVVLAVAYPHATVTLIDSTRKKLDAVAAMAAACGIANVRTVHGRIETLTEKYDLVTARGVAALDPLLSWCRGLMKRKTLLLALKGPRLTEEIAALSPQNRRQWTIDTHDANVPELPGHRIAACRLKKA